MNSCWPSGPPAIGQTAELSTPMTMASLRETAIWASFSDGAPWHMWRSDSAIAS